jgi:hypothetical protein
MDPDWGGESVAGFCQGIWRTGLEGAISVLQRKDLRVQRQTKNFVGFV